MEHHLTRFLTVLGGERGYSDNTTAAYRNDLAQFADFLRQAPGGPVSEPQAITAEVAGGYVAELHRRNYAPSTIARKVAAVKSFFHYLAQSGAMQSDLADELDAPKVKKNLPKTLSRDEVERLLDAAAAGRSAKAIRDRALLRFLYATGMRVTEVVTLRIEDVSDERNEVQLRGRGNRGRAVPIPGETMQALTDYLAQARPQLLKDQSESALFVNHRGQKLTRQGLWLIIKEHAEAAGIADVTPHTLRHSFASHRLNDGADLKELQDLLGHANLSTTQVYATVSRPPDAELGTLPGAPGAAAVEHDSPQGHAPQPVPETEPETEVV
jgi:integrase/recombinase XerD